MRTFTVFVAFGKQECVGQTAGWTLKKKVFMFTVLKLKSRALLVFIEAHCSVCVCMDPGHSRSLTYTNITYIICVCTAEYAAGVVRHLKAHYRLIQ